MGTNIARLPQAAREGLFSGNVRKLGPDLEIVKKAQWSERRSNLFSDLCSLASGLYRLELVQEIANDGLGGEFFLGPLVAQRAPIQLAGFDRLRLADELVLPLGEGLV